MDGIQTINFSNIFVSCYSNNAQKCIHLMRDHGLVFIFGGEFELIENGKISRFYRGDCLFIRKDNCINGRKLPKNDEQFKSIWLSFTRDFLREFFQTLDKKQLPNDAKRHEAGLQKLPAERPDIKSLFESMMPYFDSNMQPTPELCKLKMFEAVYCLLNTDKNFYAALFDFSEPWKIDILDYLNKNYMYDLSMEDIAGFTGRSLATFKRDFKKISPLSPQKWLIQKRLDAAQWMLISEHKTVSEVYAEVGFKNFSHFSRVYKATFGHMPSNIPTI